MLITMTVLCYLTCFCSLLFSAHLFRMRPVQGIPCYALAALFLVFAAQNFFLALILNLNNAGFFAILRPTMAMTIGPLFLLFFTSATDLGFRLRTYHVIHLVPALVIAYQFLSGTFLVNIDYSIIASFATYTVWTATTLTRNSSAIRELTPRSNTTIKWMIGLASLPGIYTVCEVLIYVDVIHWLPLSDSGSLLATLSFNIVVCVIVMSAALQRPSPLDLLFSIGEKKPHSMALGEAEIDEISVRLTALVNLDGFFAADAQSLTQVARQLGIPSRVLSESLGYTYGESFVQFMNRQRVDKAKELLDSPSYRSMFDVMLDSGFRTKSTFNKVFKDVQGQTPTEYRNQNCP